MQLTTIEKRCANALHTNEMTLKMLNDLIEMNYNEAESLSRKDYEKYDEKISNLHQFNSRLYYIKSQLLDMIQEGR